MVFTINNNYNIDADTFKTKILLIAKKAVLLFPMKATEIALNEVLSKKYHKTLKQLCLSLVLRCNINTDNTNSAIITFPNKKDDELAAFITYGNLDICGSSILQVAFRQK